MKESTPQSIPIAEKPVSAEDRKLRSLTEEEKSGIMAWKISNARLLIEKFPPETHKEIAQILIEKGADLRIITRNIDKFTGLDHNEIVKLIIEKEKGGEFNSIGHTIDKFVGLDHKEIAKLLIESGHGYSLAMNIDKFTGLDHKEIASSLIEGGKGSAVAWNLEKFVGLDHKKIFKNILDFSKIDDDTSYLTLNLDKFAGPDQSGFLKWLFENRYYVYAIKSLNQGILTEWNSDLAKTIINLTDYAPNAKSFIAELQQIGLWSDSLLDTHETFFALVDLSQNAKKNVELFQEHAWLARAFTANPRDSFRLILSFPELDKHSQENIEMLYEIKSKSSIDPIQDPAGFRRYTQESLRNYKNNNEMYDLISARMGRPMDTFLNYE